MIKNKSKSLLFLLVVSIITVSNGCSVKFKVPSSNLIHTTNPSNSGESISTFQSNSSSMESSIFSDSSILSSVFSTSSFSENNSTTTSVQSLSSYYSAAEGLNKDALKNALHNIIKGHTKFSYSSLWDLLGETDEDPNNSNNVILIYSGISRAKSNHGGNSGQWNREHVFPQSKGTFNTSAGPGTDLHHLRPEDVTVNSTRGNLDFANVNHATAKSTYGNYYTSNAFEPRDEVKGDVARMIFYMAVRYLGNGEVNLKIVDRFVTTNNGEIGKLSDLLLWNLQDPPDEFETRRNEIVFSYQKNRNPFIDYPNFANLIWG